MTRLIPRVSLFKNVPLGPPDAILGITEAFKASKDPRKINLGVGAYRDDQGKPYVLPSVLEAEKAIMDRKMDKEYAGITGVPAFTKLAAELVYGPKSSALAENRVVVAQSISGTGALRFGGEFLARFAPNKTIYLPTPSWGNHKPIFTDSGLQVKQYRYYNPETISLDIDGMLADIRQADPGSIILLHACAHNPTGVDPTRDQWRQISEAVKEGDHYVFFDSAYQGFASGDVDGDAYAPRYFLDQGHRMCLSQSFAKNMGLYGERVGSLSIVCESEEEKQRVESQLKILVRAMISNPPIHGARIVAEVLGNEKLNKQWLGEVKGMADRIKSMRALLRNHLEKDFNSKHDWSHVTNQIGMFCYTGLKPDAVDALRTDHNVFMTRDGRISVAGVTSGNVQYLAESIYKVVG